MLILKILLDFCLNIDYKLDRFFQILLKKDIKFILIKKNNTVAFCGNFIFFSLKLDFFSEKQDYKKYALVIYNISYIKRIFAFLTKVIVFFI